MKMFVQCAGCGECIEECIRGAIVKSENGVEIDTEKCFSCGHCVAVCPTDAIEHPLSPRQPLIGALPAGEDMARYLRAARSVRRYTAGLVSREKMLELLDIGRYAQTPNNSQGVSYMVVEGREKILKLIALIEETALRDPALQGLGAIAARQREMGEDIIFRGCSQLILALGDEKSGKGNAQFALTFIATLAPMLGIGTCWAGMFERVATDDAVSGPFLQFLNVPEGRRIRGAMMVGIPDVCFRRLAARDPLSVEWR